MRIISGKWRGRPLVAPKGLETRPTADRTRETLFSMLYSRLGTFEGLTVADLFAGSGALGLEALSRGAEHCLFVDQEATAIDAINANIRTLGATRAETEVRRASVLSLGHTPKPFDLVLLDPPYATGAGNVALDKLSRLGLIGPGSWTSVETGRAETVDAAGFEIDAERIVGKAKLTLLRRT
ncbi:16S rRNA (guanine(966)-N(2))-methyltransferase RsmD [Sphingobium sufflavum]|uniref:16S rRNA (guanine(966)-N(2))-methyltransferase RsmD n=1 Tax=Sphingobium sufflavum TaxID=1129547 RepID=UPI001F2040C8|nr:16S rRNA (guanine(966)-N(2))-methyltransferase RsmD [Sphingobium sufflavum]MCE7797037.1 16S rRNA (guanine(966)-N(2))-methyltransferase RsmD [Sphingobium sufflavum]